MYQAMTRDEKYIVIAVYGDAETMETKDIQVYSGGNVSEREACTIDELKLRIDKWAKSKR